MDGMNKLAVALLIVAIVFSVISVSLILGLADLNFTKLSTAAPSAAVVQGNQAGNVNLEVLSSGGAP